MAAEEKLDPKVVAARSTIEKWLRRLAVALEDDSAGAIASTACAQLKMRHGLDLRTIWNPSAHCFEARWEDTGRPAEGIERPFCDENQDHARLLACAALLRLVAILEGSLSADSKL
jgi:hypothetical protein